MRFCCCTHEELAHGPSGGCGVKQCFCGLFQPDTFEQIERDLDDLGSEYRNDWSDVDGRTIQDELSAFSGRIRLVVLGHGIDYGLTPEDGHEFKAGRCSDCGIVRQAHASFVIDKEGTNDE